MKIPNNSLENQNLNIPQVQTQGKRSRIKQFLIGGGTIVTLAVVGVVALSIQDSFSMNPQHHIELLSVQSNEPSIIEADAFYNDYNVDYDNCRFDQDQLYGYIVNTKKFSSQRLEKANQRLLAGKDLTINPRTIIAGNNNELITNVSFAFGMNDYKIGMLTLNNGDEKKERFEIPESIVKKRGINPTMRLEMLGLKVEQEPFSFSFTDLRDEKNVFIHNKDSSFVFMDKYIQMDLQLPSTRLYGFGERVSSFALGEGTWTMWANGQNGGVTDDGLGGKQGYGVHPFILVQSKNKGDYYGMFFRNANAQSPLIKFNGDGGSTLSYITTGGIIEIYFFFHGTPKNVIQQYLHVIGHPNLPPFWSLGWAQSSWGYDSEEKVQQVINGYNSNNYPLETIFLDIPYMKDFTDFTVDPDKFPDIKKIASTLHHNRQRLALIVDAGFTAKDPNSKFYKMAQDKQCLIQTSIPDNKAINKGALTADVFGGPNVFLDWLHPSAMEVWSRGLLDLYEQVPYDGLWLDMNEFTSVCNGECPPKPATQEKKVESEKLRDDASWYYAWENQDEISTYKLPFIPGGSAKLDGNLDANTLSLNATHATGDIQYNIHSLNGLLQTEHTYAFLISNNSYHSTDDRPFILTRSTFSGSGRYASHWLGDSKRTWQSMKQSIAGMMNMNMFGIPHVGADICGFDGATLDVEMCARWYQLATFYPFARNHYSKDSAPAEPYLDAFNGPWSQVIKSSMHNRYSFLRHMYTCLFEAMLHGNTCIDPLFFHYPLDDNTYLDIEESFIVGGALKISPVLKAGVTDKFDTYFPAGRWVSMNDLSQIVVGGKRVTLTTDYNVETHLRPGSLFAYQDNNDWSVTRTTQLIEKPITIVCNRDEEGKATGSLLLDKGIARSEMYRDQYEYYQMSLQAKTLQKFLVNGQHATQKVFFDRLVIVDAEDLADTDFACFFTTHLEVINLIITYDHNNMALYLISKDPVYFYSFRQINYGSTKKGDVNLCSPSSYTYHIKEGSTPDLTQSSSNFLLEHDGTVLPDLRITLSVVEANTVNVKWTFDKVPEGWRKPFEVPQDIIPSKKPRHNTQLNKYLTIKDKPFGITIIGSKNETILSINEILLDSYLNYISSTLNTTKGSNFTGIFGLGERSQADLFLEDGVYTSWNLDSGMPLEDGRPQGKNIYGTHPFYMYKNSDTNWVGVFTNLAAAQDWYIKNNKEKGEVTTTMVAVGGVADLYFIVDSSPILVQQSYLDIVGKPVLIPQWALGWHQCRWGYKETQDLKWVIGNYSEHNLPLDTQWSDIDYMYSYRDFTYDHLRYGELGEFVTELHDKGIHYVPIIDAGIAVRPWGEYPVYDLAIEKDVFIKINKDQTFIGQVWPNDAAYPDFFKKDAVEWWKEEIGLFNGEIEFDGLWQDMNEASNFCNGVCYPDQKVDKPVKYLMKYTPGGRDIEIKNIAMDAYHSNGYQEIDTHSLFGTMQTKASHEWFKEQKKRTFIISRSSYAGHGKFGSKWLGDNGSNTVSMGQSVVGIMMMNIFGIPFVGSDICGFGGTTNAELCARWHFVGAFQPFSRNHNAWGERSQEPHHFKEEYYEHGITYTDIMRMSMRVKYSLIKYYYSEMFQTSTNGAAPIYKPLFFNYPNDILAFRNINKNVMVGDSLKVSLLSDETGKNTSSFYFPKGTWCNVFNQSEKCLVSKGESHTLRTKAYDYYVHLKQGAIIPFQNAYALNVNTTAQLQESPVELHIHGLLGGTFGVQWEATGTYINDDGETFELEGNVNKYTIQASQYVQNGVTKIVIQFAVEQAYNYLGPFDDTKCSAINQNDYLDDIHFYNAKALGAVNKFIVQATFLDGTELTIGEANYSAYSDRLVYIRDPKITICMPSLSLITFVKTK